MQLGTGFLVKVTVLNYTTNLVKFHLIILNMRLIVQDLLL